MMGVMPILQMGLSKKLSGPRSHSKWQRQCLSPDPFNFKALALPIVLLPSLPSPVFQEHISYGSGSGLQVLSF